MLADVSESPHNFVVESPPTIELSIEFVPATSEITSDQSVPGEQDGILDDGGKNEEEEQIPIPPKVFRCKTCLGRFSYSYAVNHCSDKSSWKCDKCGEVIKQSNNIVRHKGRCHNKMEKLKTAAVEASESVAVHVCTMCEGIFKSKASLKTHMNVKHKEAKEGHLECEQCDFKTKHKNQLTKHITMAHKNKTLFSCDKCTFSCYSISGIGRHKVRVHKASTDTPDLLPTGRSDPPPPHPVHRPVLSTADQVYESVQSITDPAYGPVQSATVPVYRPDLFTLDHVYTPDLSQQPPVNESNQNVSGGMSTLYGGIGFINTQGEIVQYETVVIEEHRELPAPNIITLSSGEEILTFAQL